MPREGKKPWDNGWYSRKHKTSEPYQNYVADREARVALWVEGIEVRAKDRAQRSPKQQLAVLDKRLGKGVGAVKERKQLKVQMEEARMVKAKADHQATKPSKEK